MVAIFATMTFSLTSCGDDDEPSVGSIVGTWEIFDEPTANGGILYAQLVQFKNDGTYVEVFIDKDEIDFVSGDWVLDGNSLTMTAHRIPIPTTSKIEKLTNKELVITTFSAKLTYTKVADSEIEKYL